jgi:hypothetical protein
VPHPELPACEAYTRFALDAGDMTRMGEDGAYRSFGEWAADGQWTEPGWEDHLTIDALGPEIVGAPLVLLAGLAYGESAAAAARRILPVADEDMLNRAARCGLRDPEIAAVASQLVAVGLRGARVLGEDIIDGEELERAEQFFTDWTLRGRSPADAR